MSQIQYPNGISRPGMDHVSDNHAGRGAHLEEDINASNVFYNDRNIALIYKKPTPVQVVRVDYPRRGKAKIVEAYYRTPSTTDYNGIYKGKYIDFEAKETRNKTSFPKYLVHPHQIAHLKKVEHHQGIGFFIIRFSELQETYLVHAGDLIRKLEEPGKSSIPHSWFPDHGILLAEGLYPRIEYLKAVDALYLKGEN